MEEGSRWLLRRKRLGRDADHVRAEALVLVFDNGMCWNMWVWRTK